MLRSKEKYPEFGGLYRYFEDPGGIGSLNSAIFCQMFVEFQNN